MVASSNNERTMRKRPYFVANVGGGTIPPPRRKTPAKGRKTPNAGRDWIGGGITPPDALRVSVLETVGPVRLY